MTDRNGHKEQNVSSDSDLSYEQLIQEEELAAMCFAINTFLVATENILNQPYPKRGVVFREIMQKEAIRALGDTLRTKLLYKVPKGFDVVPATDTSRKSFYYPLPSVDDREAWEELTRQHAYNRMCSYFLALADA